MTVYLLAHGSADPRHALDVAVIASRLADELGEPVRACYLDLCPPSLAACADVAGVVVPLLFSPGYHVQVDVGEAVAAAGVPLRLAPPPLLTSAAGWGADLVRESAAGWPGRRVVMVTAGTRDAGVLAEWDLTAEALGVPVVHAGGAGPRLADLAFDPATSVVLPVLAARGFFGDMIAEQAAARGAAVAGIAGTSEALLAELARCVRQAKARPA